MGDAFDALADLFLSGKPARAENGDRQHAEPTGRVDENAGENGHARSNTSTGTNSNEHGESHKHGDRYNQVVDRNSPASRDARGAVDADPANSHATRSQGVEVLIIGHLPVIASAWVHQYARSSIGEGTASIGLVRRQRDSLRVDLFSSASVGGRASMDHRGHPGEQAALAAAAACDRVVVTGDQSMEMVLAAHPAAGRVTLLIGADEASVVAAYGRLKRLAEARADASGQCPVGIAVMGAGEERAIDVHRRIAAAAKSFLSIEVALTAWVERIGARAGVCAASVHDAKPVASIDEVMSSIAANIDHTGINGFAGSDERVLLGGTAASRASAVDAADVAAMVAGEPEGLIEFVPEADEPTGETADYEPGEVMRAKIAGALVEERREHEHEHEPKRERERETENVSERDLDVSESARSSVATKDVSGDWAQRTARGAGHSDEGTGESFVGVDLAALVGGLHGVRATCPYAADVQIAVDAHAGLHVLAMGEAGDALRRMSIVRDWLTQHAALVAMTTDKRVDISAKITAHLLVIDARQAKRLLEGDVKVHVVARVSRPGLVACELN